MTCHYFENGLVVYILCCCIYTVLLYIYCVVVSVQVKNYTLHAYKNLDFRPVFKVLDEVTGVEETYLGMYTLKALAGGLSVDSMKSFSPSSNM